jgi:hypothetical protein
LKITMPWSGAAGGTLGARIGFANLAASPCRRHGWAVLVAFNAARRSRTAGNKITSKAAQCHHPAACHAQSLLGRSHHDLSPPLGSPRSRRRWHELPT